MKKSNFLPLSRSSHYGNSRYFAEIDFTIINRDEIINETKTHYEESAIHALTVFHENVHAFDKYQGETILRMLNSKSIMDELLHKKEQPWNVNKIITLELVNQILFQKSTILDEASAAFEIDMLQNILDLPKNVLKESLKHWKISYEKLQKTVNELNEFAYIDAENFKNGILEDDTVKHYYDELKYIGQKYHSWALPKLILRLSKDISYASGFSSIIKEDKKVDPIQRFDKIISIIKNEVESEKLKKILESKNDEDYANDEIRIRERLAVLLNQITDLDFGEIDSLNFGIPDYVRKIQFLSYKNSSSSFNAFSTEPSLKIKPSKFYEFDVRKIAQTKYKKSILYSVKYYFWYGVMERNKLYFVTDTQTTNDELKEFWIKNFVKWILKECIISDEDIETTLNMINLTIDKNNVQTAQRIKNDIELDKAENYEKLKNMIQE